MLSPVLSDQTTSLFPHIKQDTCRVQEQKAILLEVEEDLPLQSYPTFVRFPAATTTVQMELYEGSNWIACLKEDETVFSEGDTQAAAQANLIESAREDLRILTEYGENLSRPLFHQLRILETLF